MNKTNAKTTTLRLTTAAVFMAMNIALSSFGVPVPGGHLYLCDVVVLKDRPRLASGIGVTIGAVIMVVGYTLGKIYVYSTFEYAMIKLPYEIAQGAVGAILGMVLCWKCGIHKLFNRMIAGQN